MCMTDFLFAQSGFLSGLARTLDIGASFESYNESKAPNKADAKAIQDDWKMTGKDISAAMSKFEDEQEK